VPGAIGGCFFTLALRHVLVVERDANNEWRRLDVRGSDGKAARLRLSARDCLQQRSQPA